MESTSTTMTLNNCFQNLESSFCPAVEKASKDFLGVDLELTMVSASYEPEYFWRDSDYFVTQINLTEDYFLVLKISSTAANQMLLGALGQRQEETGFLRLKDITELEANILTACNEHIYTGITALLLDRKEINSILHTLKNEKTLYFTFYINGNRGEEAGRIILALPEFAVRKKEPVTPPETPLDIEFFNRSTVETSILIGKSRASLDDVKKLEPEDLIVLEDSNLHTMYLKDFENISINVNPSHDFVLDFEDEENGDEDIVSEVKDKNVNIWDSLEVDVNASFEKVKMKLGDLREITEGLVVDVASIADNKVYIEVENRQLAVGELVIIGDKYGVRITEICKEARSREVEKLEEEATSQQQELEPEEPVEEHREEVQEMDEMEEMEEIEDDLEDSDFELEEDNEEEEY